MSNRGWRFDQIPTYGQVGISFEPIQYFEAREMAARTHQYPHEDRIWTGVSISRDLLLRRSKKKYREPLQIALLYLFVKSINAILAAVSISKSGYSFEAWPLIRGSFEAAELMDYLCRHPEDVEQWINREKRFDQLSWLRNWLPDPELRKTFYNTVNDLSHANLRPIDAFNTLRFDESGTRYLIVGPNPLPLAYANPIEGVSIFISYPIRVLWQSDPGVMDTNWVTRFHSFDEQAHFPYGEPWNYAEQIG